MQSDEPNDVVALEDGPHGRRRPPVAGGVVGLRARRAGPAAGQPRSVAGCRPALTAAGAARDGAVRGAPSSPSRHVERAAGAHARGRAAARPQVRPAPGRARRRGGAGAGPSDRRGGQTGASPSRGIGQRTRLAERPTGSTPRPWSSPVARHRTSTPDVHRRAPGVARRPRQPRGRPRATGRRPMRLDRMRRLVELLGDPQRRLPGRSTSPAPTARGRRRA